jgi:hypothetical protein
VEDCYDLTTKEVICLFRYPSFFENSFRVVLFGETTLIPSDMEMLFYFSSKFVLQ